MASSSQTSSAGFRLARYVEELHEFFASHRMPFGYPQDVPPFADRLSMPGLFHDEMVSMTRSIILREGGNVPRAELLQLVTLAVGGAHVEESAPEYLQAVLQILSFLADVHRSRWGIAPEELEPDARDAVLAGGAMEELQSGTAATAEKAAEAVALPRPGLDIYSRGAVT
jgi:hypothetical protein